MNIVVNQHPHYNYLDASICQGLQKLGHAVTGASLAGTNYVEHKWQGNPVDLFVQFVKGQCPLIGVPSIMVWGEDDQNGLAAEFIKGFQQVFVRDHLPGTPGIPINFAIEDRYYCATEQGYKPLKDRYFDVCFLGKLYPARLAYVEKLKIDFPGLNMLLGPRTFNTPDNVWSRWTQPWCAHDPGYFETLANSRICLALNGAGPDTGRKWEILASGAICAIEDTLSDGLKPDSYWFSDYSSLKHFVTYALGSLETEQSRVDAAFTWNRVDHSTKSRAAYLLEMIGMK